MYDLNLITGRALPDRTLSLTYDDGPGPATLRLGQYLREMNCSATFFVLGRHAEQYFGACARLRALGHCVGNHTHSHQDLVKGLTAGADNIDDIRRTDGLVQEGTDEFIFFRPPFGSWSAAVAETLNANKAISSFHIGPIYWDFDSRDWEYCSQGKSPRDCADFCLAEIHQKRRGILLMHDGSADRDSAVQAEFTFRTTQLLLPPLLKDGYRIVPLTEIPRVAGHLGRSGT